MALTKARIVKKVTKKVEDELEAEEYVTLQQQKKIKQKKQKIGNPICDVPAPESILDFETGEVITFDTLNRDYLPPKSIKTVPINNEQFDCCKKILAWIHTNPKTRQAYWRLGGLAGTGKTTVISYIMNECQQLFPSAIRYKEIAVLTYAWKAALVLRSKGVEASSIHSLFYQLDGVGSDGTPIFAKRNPDEVRDSYGLIVIDEASMTDRDMRSDVESFGIPVLYVGDHGQLPSVSPHPEDATFMSNAECKLETVNRQALDSPIIRLSMDVRLGKTVPYGEYGKGVYKIHPDELPERLLLKTDQVLCSYNKTRTSVNKLIRKMHGYDTRAMPYAGEKLMGLGNVLERFVYNGQIWYSEDDNSAYTLKDSKSVTMSLLGEDGNDKRIIRTIFPEDTWFKNPNKKEVYDFLNEENIYQVDFGYACTVHKSQGSSFNRPILIDEFMNDKMFMRRLRYTGITRAVSKLIWVCD